MQALTGAVLVAAALLVLAGVPKIARPTSTVAALRAVGLTFVTRWQVRALAVVEVAVGVLAIVRGGVVVDLAVAALYTGFSVFLIRALRSGGTTSCGCTARSDTPPTYAHLVLTVGLAVLAGAAAVTGGHTGLTELSDADAILEPLLVAGYAAVGTWFAWVIMNDLPDLRLLRSSAGRD